MKKYLLVATMAFYFGTSVAQQNKVGQQTPKEPTAEELYNEAIKHLRGEDGMFIDSIKAINLFIESGNMGYAPSQYETSQYFFNKDNPSYALEWLIKSVKQDYIPAIEYYWAYNSNIGNINEANKWLRKGAELGYPKFQWFLGYNFHYGEDGFPVNSTQAIFWLEKAANQNQPEAAYELGEMYLNIHSDIVKRDIQKAVYWLKKASDLGDSNAQYSLALMYEHGEGVDIDKEMAFKLMKKSASSGNARAQHNLGAMFVDGIGCQKNIDSAKYWFKLAFENENADEETKESARHNMKILIANY